MVRGALIALLAWLASPAAATQDAWPALFDVAGVASDDVLNVRSRPAASAPIVAELGPDAQGIEVIRPDAGHGWGLVNTGEGTGWVSLHYLARRPGQWSGAFPPLARCFGTEPFWTLDMGRGDAAAWLVPGGTVPGRITGRLGSLTRRDRHGLTATLRDGRDIAAVISWRACSDGMSDRAYGLGFDAILGGVLHSGCCSLSDGPVAEPVTPAPR